MSTQNTYTTWTDLVSAALVGTDRRPFIPDPARPAADPAQALLQQAVLLSVPVLTGTEPALYDGPLPEPAPDDDRPLIPSAPRLRLHALLDAYPKYLGEWLAAVRDAGYRLPLENFPGLLDAARTHTAIRGALATVLGERGHWLARQNADWRYLLREPFGPLRPEDWDGPDPDARLAYANGLYAADPEAARALFTAAWPTLTAAVKMSLLGLVNRYSGDDDLPFVEGLARDASKQVRDEAHAIEAQIKARDRRIARLAPEKFSAEVARIVTAKDPIDDLYRYATPQARYQWPIEGARVVLTALIAYSRDEAAGTTRGSWAAGQLLGMLADCAPLELGPEARLAVEAHTAQLAAGVVSQLDFSALLTPLGFRADLHAELTAPADAPGQE